MNAAPVVTGHAALSCLGTSSETTWQALLNRRTGLHQETVSGGYRCPVGRIPEKGRQEKFADLVYHSLLTAPVDWRWPDPATGWILCSAKYNVAALQHGQKVESLASIAAELAAKLGLATTPYCISTACTSSLAGIVLAVRLLRSGRYRRLAITGCDLASDFVLNGFNRIQAISSEVCRPYDAKRNGINLATAAATLYLEWKTPASGEISITGAATSNDGFHISRPAPDGSGLGDCIRRSCGDRVPDFICGHGTATILNDNMESEAIARSGMASVPTFSVKGQLGHTLGACGVLETIVTLKCLQKNTILPSLGFDAPGTTATININRSSRTQPLRTALNLAVGFGGGNAAVYLTKS